MLKVSSIEDESVIREGFRNKTPWRQYGFKLAGEAGDGEMAPPLTRKVKPDILLADIKIPSMDRLSLNEIVKEEFPKMKIITVSGYDNFEYARQVIAVGVDQYLLESITRTVLRDALLEIEEKIEQEPEQKDHQARYQGEMQEFEQFVPRRSFEKVLDGKLSVRETYEEAAQESIPLTISCYNLLLFPIYEKHGSPAREPGERFMRRQEEVFHYFLRHPQCILFRLNVNCCDVLIRREPPQTGPLTENSLAHMKQVCDPEEADTSWYVAVETPVERLSLLPQCYERVNHYFACRFIMSNQHILTETTLADCLGGQEEEKLEKMDLMRMDLEIIRDFLARGGDKGVRDFVESYLQSINSALKSRVFRGYIILNIRLVVAASLEPLGADQKDYQDDIEETVRMIHRGDSQVLEYFALMLRTAVETRNRKNSYQGEKVLKKALDYIDENHDGGALSLNLVVEHIGMSANYLNAIFSQTMQKAFVEYVIEKRIEKARKLLKRTDGSSSEIVKEVGYKDAHYFSFVFKRQLGCSSREYRTEGKH